MHTRSSTTFIASLTMSDFYPVFRHLTRFWGEDLLPFLVKACGYYTRHAIFLDSSAYFKLDCTDGYPVRGF